MNVEDTRYQRAKERVEEIKGFYIHLTVYIIINPVLFIINWLTSPDNLWFYWPLLGWGIGLVIHMIWVFGFSKVLGTGLEERKIQEIMDKE